MCKFCECKYCTQEYTESETTTKSQNQIEIASSPWTGLFIGVNEQGKTVLRACGTDYTDDCIINYCPFCGRKLD